MKAVRVHNFGLEHPMQLEEIEEPKPGEGEVLIRNRAIGVHPVDLAVRGALHPFHRNVTPPYIPGVEAAGEVMEVGPGVEGFHVGQRACGRCIGGAYAEVVRLGAVWSLGLPDSYSFSEGSGLVVQFLTAWNALVLQGTASAGENVLVHGGAGGVGMASVQLAKAMGCRVFATARSKEKADLCLQVGADEAILYREEDFAARCMDLTRNQGVDLIVEVAADANLSKDVDAIRAGGRIVVVGTAKALDPEACFGVQKALLKDARIVCMSMPNLQPRLPETKRRLIPMLESGRFKVPVFREIPLAEANAAHEIAWGGDHVGKLVLIP